MDFFLDTVALSILRENTMATKVKLSNFLILTFAGVMGSDILEFFDDLGELIYIVILRFVIGGLLIWNICTSLGVTDISWWIWGLIGMVVCQYAVIASAIWSVIFFFV